MLESHRLYYQLQAQEAVARTEGLFDPKYLERIRTRPVEQASWFDLPTLAQGDPALARQRREQIKQTARVQQGPGGLARGVQPNDLELAQRLAAQQAGPLDAGDVPQPLFGTSGSNLHRGYLPFVTATAYTCVGPCMLELNTTH